MERLTSEKAKAMLIFTAEELIKKEEYLGDIDRAIGDGDHGIGMSSGAKAICDVLQNDSITDIDQVFKKAGMAMMESMGGASGVIFSSLFLGVGKAAGKKEDLSVEEFGAGLREAVAMIQKRGKAQLGDKTMLDSLIPVADVFQKTQSVDFLEVLEEAVQAAYEGVEKTKKYPAKFGRAKFLGERSLDKQDAGATSVAIIFEAMHEYLKGGIMMKVGFGADENAVEFKNTLKEYAEELGYEVVDFGYYSDSPVDYPAIAFEVAKAVKSETIDRGILCCGTGIGMAIAANKVPGIRAAQLTDIYSAERAQLSNNAQIATFGAFVQGIDSAKLLLEEYLSQSFEAGTRSERKINQIMDYEKNLAK